MPKKGFCTMKKLILLLLICFVNTVSAQKLSMDLVKEMHPRNIGPGGMSGRVTAIDVVTHNPDIMYVGTASGGLWKTTGGGTKWEPIFDNALIEEERSALLEGGYELARVTENTLYQTDSLQAEMAAIRAQGFACDREEHAIGLHCVAACIFDEHATPLAAISVSGPMARIPEERLLVLGALVRQIAAEITQQLGGQLPR